MVIGPAMIEFLINHRTIERSDFQSLWNALENSECVITRSGFGDEAIFLNQAMRLLR